MMRKNLVGLGICLMVSFTTVVGFADFELTWHTIDGGGVTSTGGDFKVSGTIGQPDAGLMVGGGFELSGGFWHAATLVCHCPGDMNGDNQLDALDIQRFVECLMLPPPTGCNCADIDRAGGVNLDDVEHFVSDLLNGESCS